MICRPRANVGNNFLIDQKLSIILTHYTSCTYLITNKEETVGQIVRDAASGGSVRLRVLDSLSMAAHDLVQKCSNFCLHSFNFSLYFQGSTSFRRKNNQVCYVWQTVSSPICTVPDSS